MRTDDTHRLSYFYQRTSQISDLVPPGTMPTLSRRSPSQTSTRCNDNRPSDGWYLRSSFDKTHWPRPSL